MALSVSRETLICKRTIIIMFSLVKFVCNINVKVTIDCLRPNRGREC